MKERMESEALNQWFEARKQTLETVYLAGLHPWQQSGVGLHTPHTAQDWEVLRRPIAGCVTISGTFLDIGCANGYLLECLLRWTDERGFVIIPYGLDFSAELLALAQKRLPQYANHLFLGNAWDWMPPQTFDYVNTTLDYVPGELRESLVHRLLAHFVQPGGCLLVAEYLGRTTGVPAISVDEQLHQWGFSIEAVKASHLKQDPLRQTRVAVVRKTT
jgi:SAM-dependent methyltransferase